MKVFLPHFRVARSALVVVVGLLSSGATFWTNGPDGTRIPAQAHLADDVRDPVFSLLAGLLDDDTFGELTPAFVDSVVVAHGETKLPHRSMQSLTRELDDQGAHAVLRLAVEEDFKVPVPYSILGYNPGSLQSSPRVDLVEWRLGRMAFWVTEDGDRRELVLKNVSLFALTHGKVRMDVDWWLDKLLGSRLDDVNLVGFLVFHQQTTRYALAFGYTDDGRGRSGVFDLTKDEIVFPAPKPYLQIGRSMRARAESWLLKR